MKDNEIRGIVLRHYYERRYEDYHQWSDEDIQKLGNELTGKIVFAICDQLADHNLIRWKPIKLTRGTANGMGKITAYGVDVIEGEVKAPISIALNRGHNITITGSSNVQIGDSNLQGVNIEIGKLLNAINNSNAKEAEKEEARSLLRSFLSHPLVSAIVGAIWSQI
jgi:hypothetical protein